MVQKTQLGLRAGDNVDASEVLAACHALKIVERAVEHTDVGLSRDQGNLATRVTDFLDGVPVHANLVGRQ